LLPRIWSLTFLWTSLLFVGLPAFACAECAPTQDCCPNGALAPCSIGGATAAPSNAVQSGCALSPAASAAFAAESSSDFHKHLKRVDWPAVLPSAATGPATHVVSTRPTAHSATSSFSPSYALLYLSTGRLRL